MGAAGAAGKGGLLVGQKQCQGTESNVGSVPQRTGQPCTQGSDFGALLRCTHLARRAITDRGGRTAVFGARARPKAQGAARNTCTPADPPHTARLQIIGRRCTEISRAIYIYIAPSQARQRSPQTTRYHRQGSLSPLPFTPPSKARQRLHAARTCCHAVRTRHASAGRSLARPRVPPTALPTRLRSHAGGCVAAEWGCGANTCSCRSPPTRPAANRLPAPLTCFAIPPHRRVQVSELEAMVSAACARGVEPARCRDVIEAAVKRARWKGALLPHLDSQLLLSTLEVGFNRRMAWPGWHGQVLQCCVQRTRWQGGRRGHRAAAACPCARR